MMQIIALCFVFLLGYGLSLQDCDDVLSGFDSFSGQCSKKWIHLKPLIKPTQPQVGYAWIQYKIENNFKSSADAQAEIDSKPTPAVIGPGPAFYIVDDHHTLCALDYSDYTDVSVTLTVLCDKRNMTQEAFWANMGAQNFAYLASHPQDKPNSMPQAINHTQLPSTFSFNHSSNSFTNDNWRSLAGYSRKVTTVPASSVTCNTKAGDSATCESCFYRGCSDGYRTTGLGVPFFEFRWAYFMNDGYLNSALWDLSTDYETFLAAYQKLSVSFQLDKIDTYAWLTAAGSIVPLCRGKAGREYEVPSDIFSGQTVLPGYYEGYIKLPEDPSCSVPVCK